MSGTVRGGTSEQQEPIVLSEGGRTNEQQTGLMRGSRIGSVGVVEAEDEQLYGLGVVATDGPTYEHSGGEKGLVVVGKQSLG